MLLVIRLFSFGRRVAKFWLQSCPVLIARLPSFGRRVKTSSDHRVFPRFGCIGPSFVVYSILPVLEPGVGASV